MWVMPACFLQQIQHAPSENVRAEIAPSALSCSGTDPLAKLRILHH
jgi:hypothetical protein